MERNYTKECFSFMTKETKWLLIGIVMCMLLCSNAVVAQTTDPVSAAHFNVMVHSTIATDSNTIVLEENLQSGWYQLSQEWRYRSGKHDLKDVWLYEKGALYYLDESGMMATGSWVIDGKEYQFQDSGALYRNGAYEEFGELKNRDEQGNLCSGYRTIQGSRYYFNEDGSLLRNGTTPDGYYQVNEDGKIVSVNMEKVEADCPLRDAPGTSGYTMGGYPVELFMVSMAGETSGATIIMGDRSRAYGMCQFDYRYDLVDFMSYAYQTHPYLWVGFEPLIGKYQTGDQALVGNMEILSAFQLAHDLSPVNYAADQAEFLYHRYFAHTYRAMESAGYGLSQRNIAVSAAIMSVNINCGTQTSLYLQHLSPDMSDEEIVNKIYELRNTILAGNGKGTNTRFQESEPRLATEMIEGSITANSSFQKSGGVAWNPGALKYCGESFSDEEIRLRYEKLKQETEPDAMEENEPEALTEAVEAEAEQKSEPEMSPVILAGSGAVIQ